MKYCIYFRPSYVDEAFLLVRYLLKTKNIKQVALFYQDDEFGQACLEGARRALARSSLKVLELPYTGNDVNFEAQATAVKNSSVNYIALFSTPIASRRFLEQLGDEVIRKTNFFGVSDIGGLTFQKMVKAKGVAIIRSNVVPDPLTSTIPLVAEYRERAKKKEAAIETFSLEGYITAMIFIDALKHMKGEITKDTMISEFENMKNYNLKGLILNFDEQTRQLSNKVWIDDGKGAWKEEEMPTLQELNLTAS
jgi:ABC-type branched-subunit amino acid transport system substrate-binding protein